MNIVDWIIIVMLGLALLYFVLRAVDKAIQRRLKETSPLLQQLRELNRTFESTFHKISTSYKFVKHNTSKRLFDRTNYNRLFQDYYNENEFWILGIVKMARENREHLPAYKKRSMQLYEDYFSTKKEGWFSKRERELFYDCLLRPTTEVFFIVRSEYVSPTGRNRYFNEREYGVKQVEKAKRLKEAQEEFKKAKNNERSKMTDSLRYDVMKRDGFRCVLCGATAAEGAVLHVDHIRPVSKGGKTELYNLRTLCDRCNLGKSDKFDEYGKN